MPNKKIKQKANKSQPKNKRKKNRIEDINEIITLSDNNYKKKFKILSKK